MKAGKKQKRRTADKTATGRMAADRPTTAKLTAAGLAAAILAAGMLFTGCGDKQDTTSDKGNETEPVAEELPTSGIGYETAADAAVDLEALKAENPDIFAWLYVPGTDIDFPVLQSEEADDYYESHNVWGKQGSEGALYTELANLRNMCDFNTVIHGKSSEDGKEGLFSDLYRFADPDFFAEHETAYLYIDGNLLTYEIFAAYERENTSLLRTYDFTYIAGCQGFLNDLYGTREMGMNLREGWEDLTPYHFLITLTTARGGEADEQYVVLAALVGDAAGTIDRVVIE